MKKKIAICFSGHFRYFDIIKYNIFEYLIDPLKNAHDVDIFVHTWDTLDSEISPKGIENRLDYNLVNKRTDINKIIDFLNPLRISILNKKACKDYLHLTKINSNHQIKLNSLNGKYSVINNELVPYSQLLGIYLANSLKKEVSNSLGIHYDCVIRTRPDFMYTTNILDLINFDNLSNNLFVPNIFKYNDNRSYAINDTFAFSNSSIMDIYSSTICSYIFDVNNNKIQYENNDGGALQYGVEQSIYRKILEFNINIKELGKINLKV